MLVRSVKTITLGQASRSRLHVFEVTDIMCAACEPQSEHESPRITTMNHSHTGSRVYCGRKLVNAGIAGIRNGQDSARGEQSLSKIAAEAARDSLTLAAIGACVGLLRSHFSEKRDRPAN